MKMKRLFRTLATALVLFSATASTFAAVPLARFSVDGIAYEAFASTTGGDPYIDVRQILDVSITGTELTLPSKVLIPDVVWNNDAYTVESTQIDAYKGQYLYSQTINYNLLKSNAANVTKITVEEGITSITGNCFKGTSLKTVELPLSVTTMVAGSFNNASVLDSIVLLNPEPTTVVMAFTSVPSTCVAVVPQGSLEAYQSAAAWGSFPGTIVESTEGTTTTDPDEPVVPTTEAVTIEGITYTLDLTSDSVAITAAEVSGDIAILDSVTFDSGETKFVATIAPSAFAGCAITSITLPEGDPKPFVYVADGTENSFDQGKECIVNVPNTLLATYQATDWAIQFTLQEPHNTNKYEYAEGDYKFMFQWSAVKISSYVGSDEEIVLPAESVVLEGGSGYLEDYHMGWMNKTLTISKVGYGAFKSATTVKKVTVSEGTAILENMSFNSTTIESIVLPTTLVTYAGSPFNSASALSSLEVQNETPVANVSFTGIPATCVLTVPAGTLEAYQEAWSEFPGTMVEKDATTTGVEAETAASVAVYANAGTIVVAGAEAGAAIEVYSVTGVQVAATVAEGETAISLAAGIYVVRVAGVTYKVVCQ